jgi:hypothetical protein
VVLLTNPSLAHSASHEMQSFFTIMHELWLVSCSKWTRSSLALPVFVRYHLLQPEITRLSVVSLIATQQLIRRAIYKAYLLHLLSH